LRWLVASAEERYMKSRVAAERLASEQARESKDRTMGRPWTPADCHLAIVNDRIVAKDLEQRVNDLWTIVESWVADSRPLDLQVASLEQRLTALEDRQTAFELSWDSQLGRDLRLRVAATPSIDSLPDTETPAEPQNTSSILSE